MGKFNDPGWNEIEAIVMGQVVITLQSRRDRSFDLGRYDRRRWDSFVGWMQGKLGGEVGSCRVCESSR